MKLEHLTVCYEGLTVAQDLTLELPDRGIVCFFAPSGTGKTTLLNVLCGLHPPQSGQVLGLEGKRFAFVFQEDRLIPELSARDNVGLVLDKNHQELAETFLTQLGLGGWENAYPDELSGGMQRRVAIARALAYGEQHRGEVVYLFDEPLKGLDEQTAAQVRQVIRTRTAGALSFFITHDREEAQQMADVIVCLAGPPLKVTQVIDNRRCL